MSATILCSWSTAQEKEGLFSVVVEHNAMDVIIAEVNIVFVCDYAIV
jgi:hypothetical protein